MLTGVTEEQVNCLLENWKLGVVRLSPEFRLVSVNSEIEQMDGRCSAELVGREFWEVWPDLIGTEAEGLVRCVMKERKGGTAPLFQMSRPGRTIYLDIRVQPWGDGVALFAIDASDRVETETAKDQIEQRYKMVSRASLDIQYEWDMAEDVWIAHGGAQELLGVPDDTGMSIKNVTSHIHPDDLEEVREKFHSSLLKGTSEWEVEYRYKRGLSWIKILDRAFVINDEEGKPVRAVGVMKDTTESEKSQMEIQRLQSELIHVSRVSAMGTMASVLAHELNQPLAAVGSYLAGAQKLLQDNDDIDRGLLLQAVQQAHEGSARAGKIIQRLRSMTKKAEHKREWVKLESAVENAVVLSLIGRTHLRSSFKIDIAPRLELQADVIQLEQVLINLIRNAVEANEEAGREGVEITARETARDMVGITISDSGNGISESLKPTLFDFFVSTKEDGMGIGLPISRTIVEAHGGKISVEPGKPYGTTFRIVLPKHGH